MKDLLAGALKGRQLKTVVSFDFDRSVTIEFSMSEGVLKYKQTNTGNKLVDVTEEDFGPELIKALKEKCFSDGASDEDRAKFVKEQDNCKLFKESNFYKKAKESEKNKSKPISPAPADTKPEDKPKISLSPEVLGNLNNLGSLSIDDLKNFEKLSVDDLKNLRDHIMGTIAEKQKMSEDEKKACFDKIIGKQENKKIVLRGNYEIKLSDEATMRCNKNEIKFNINKKDILLIKIANQPEREIQFIISENSKESDIRDIFLRGELTHEDKIELFEYAYKKGLLTSDDLRELSQENTQQNSNQQKVTGQVVEKKIADLQEYELKSKVKDILSAKKAIEFKASDMILQNIGRDLKDGNLKPIVKKMIDEKDTLSDKMKILSSKVEEALKNSDAVNLSSALEEMRKMRNKYFNKEVLKEALEKDMKSNVYLGLDSKKAMIVPQLNSESAIAEFIYKNTMNSTVQNTQTKILSSAFTHIKSFLEAIDSAELAEKILREGTEAQKKYIRDNVDSLKTTEKQQRATNIRTSSPIKQRDDTARSGTAPTNTKPQNQGAEPKKVGLMEELLRNVKRVGDSEGSEITPTKTTQQNQVTEPPKPSLIKQRLEELEKRRNSETRARNSLAKDAKMKKLLDEYKEKTPGLSDLGTNAPLPKGKGGEKLRRDLGSFSK